MMIWTSIFPPHTPSGKKFSQTIATAIWSRRFIILSEVPVILGYGFVQFPRGSWGHHPNSFRFTPVSGEAAAGGVSENPPKLATAALKNGRVDVFQVFVSWLHEPKSWSLIHGPFFRIWRSMVIGSVLLLLQKVRVAYFEPPCQDMPVVERISEYL